MKIYLVHPDVAPDHDTQIDVETIRKELTRLGHLVMPQVDEFDEGEPRLTTQPWIGENAGLRITADIDACDLLVGWTYPLLLNGRVDTSIGYALGKGKQIIIIGPVRNVILCLPEVTRYVYVAEALDAIEHLA